MSRGLLAIGVGNAPPLKKLNGAIRDAEAMANWAKRAGYEHVWLFTDRKGPVQADALYKCCKALIAIPDLEQLVIFFAGHGYSPFNGHETWLLSEWKTESNEAINATQSIQYAQGFSQPRISFIADACRTTYSTKAPPVGVVIVPPPGDELVAPQVDQFFATPFGYPAQEVSLPEDAYGVFGREVCRGLKGAAVETRAGQAVVTSRSLKDFLDDAVPAALEAIPNAAMQLPDTNARWRPPTDVYVAFPQVAKGPGTLTLPPSPKSKQANRKRAAQDVAVQMDADRLKQAMGRQSFETETGITVLGAKVSRVALSEGTSDEFEEDGIQQVRVHCHRAVTAMLQLDHPQWQNHWVPVGVYPRLIATLVVDDHGVSNVNYQPSLYTPSYVGPGPSVSAAMLAEVSAMLRHGQMPEEWRVQQMVSQLRDGKDDNPALAILAAHLCQRIGDVTNIREMQYFPIGLGAHTPFDLLLLSGSRTASRTVVGQFPFLARGWALLRPEVPWVDSRLLAAAENIAPSLWTLAEPTAAEIMLDVMQIERPEPEPEPMAIV